MALNIGEANALVTVLSWLDGRPQTRGIGEIRPASSAEAADALHLLARSAGKALLSPGSVCQQADDAMVRAAARRAGEDSDGAAQAVCHALAEHVAYGGTIPSSSIRPLDDWQRLHDTSRAFGGRAAS